MYKKYILFSAFFLSLFCCTAALSQAVESTAELEKISHPVFENTYYYSPDIVQGALEQQLQRDHIKARSHRNTVTCKGVVYPTLSTVPLDLYFETEGKGKKGKGSTILKLFVSKGKDNFIGQQYDTALARKLLDYLNQFKNDVDYYALQQQIIDKEKDLDKATDKYKKILKNKRKLTGKEYDLKKDLSAESDPKKLKKLRKKIHKAYKKTESTSRDIDKAELDLQQRKGEIQALQSRLQRMRNNNGYRQ